MKPFILVEVNSGCVETTVIGDTQAVAVILDWDTLGSEPDGAADLRQEILDRYSQSPDQPDDTVQDVLDKLDEIIEDAEGEDDEDDEDDDNGDCKDDDNGDCEDDDLEDEDDDEDFDDEEDHGGTSSGNTPGDDRPAMTRG